MASAADSLELLPAVELGLDLGGIIGAENVLGDGAAIDQRGGAALEGDALHDAVLIGRSLNGVLVRVGEIVDAESGDVLGEVGVGILLDVVGFGQEQVDLLIVGRGGLVEQGRVQLVLIGVVVARGDDPVDGHAFGNGVVLLKEALELLVPGVDVEDLAFGGRGLGSGSLGGGSLCSGSRSSLLAAGAERKHHDEGQKHCDELFHFFSS